MGRPEQIDLTRAKSEGVRDFKHSLELAAFEGGQAIVGTVTAGGRVSPVKPEPTP